MEWFKRRGGTQQVHESKTPVFTVSTPSTPELGIDFQTPPTPSRLGSLVGAFRRTRRAHPRAAQPQPSSLGSIVVATVFGLRRPGARIHLAIQPHPRSPPLAVIELATTTGAFMADIASGPLNFVLQCAARGGDGGGGGRDAPPLWEEARWAQFCNGRVCGSARRRGGGDADAVDLRVIEMLEHVSFGAGILLDYYVGRGRGTGTVDLVYMRARYERVVRSKDAEALSMLGSEVKGYPEISFNFIRV